MIFILTASKMDAHCLFLHSTSRILLYYSNKWSMYYNITSEIVIKVIKLFSRFTLIIIACIYCIKRLMF